MSQFIKFYLTSSMLNMFRTLIYPSSGACDFSIVSPHWLCVLVLMCVGVSVWLVGVVSMWQAETNLMSQFIKFYFTSSMLNMFRTLIHPSSGACDFSVVSPHWLCVGVSVMLVGVVSVWQAEAVLHPATRIPSQCGDKIETSQAPDDGCINVRNMLSI